MSLLTRLAQWWCRHPVTYYQADRITGRMWTKCAACGYESPGWRVK